MAEAVLCQVPVSALGRIGSFSFFASGARSCPVISLMTLLETPGGREEALRPAEDGEAQPLRCPSKPRLPFAETGCPCPRSCGCGFVNFLLPFTGTLPHLSRNGRRLELRSQSVVHIKQLIFFLHCHDSSLFCGEHFQHHRWHFRWVP